MSQQSPHKPRSPQPPEAPQRADVDREPIRFSITLSQSSAGLRLDQALARALIEMTDLQLARPVSVKRVKRWVEEGRVCAANLEARSDEQADQALAQLRPSTRVNGGEQLSLALSRGALIQDERRSSPKSVSASHLITSAQSKTRSFWEHVHAHAQSSPKVQPAQVIYLDHHLIALNKPPSIPTAPTVDPRRESLYHRAFKTLVQDLDAGERPYLRVTHRLDRDTSGVVLMSRDARVNRALGEAFASHTARKRYWLLCRRPRCGLLADYLARAVRLDLTERFESLVALEQWSTTRPPHYEPRGTPLSISTPIGQLKRTSGDIARWGTLTPHNRANLKRAQSAETLLYAVALTSEIALLEARPLTGRTHQIRVHLVSLNAPLLGDEIYGGSPWSRLALHARALALPHPTSQESLNLYAPLKNDIFKK